MNCILLKKFFNYFFYSQSKTNQNMYSRDMSKQTNTIAKANLCINHENKLRISRLNTGREIEVNASSGKLFQRNGSRKKRIKKELDFANG